MKDLAIAIAIAAGMLLGTLGAHAKLPPTPPKSDAQKAADAEKVAAAKAKDAENNAKAVDKAVSNYKKNKGIPDPQAAVAAKAPAGKAAAAKAPAAKDAKK